ncbi:MAG: ethanolamine ammonia-lyase light chain EutC [Gammaproteobacteria bacterium]
MAEPHGDLRRQERPRRAAPGDPVARHGEAEPSRERLAGFAGPMDVCLIVANGLSSTAVERHGLPLLSAVLMAFGARHLTLGPVVLAANGRVALSTPP